MKDRGFKSKWVLQFEQLFLYICINLLFFNFFWLLLLVCLWNSKRCCGPPFTTPISMKVKTNGQELNNISVDVW
jgi:hypothetical protein